MGRWVAAVVALAIGAALLLRRWKLLPGQHFHLYLAAYGLFRFFHEFLRSTPAILGPISGYQVAALAVALLGIIGFVRRRRGR